MLAAVMHVFLTGASSGIGEALAKAFARAGHALTLVARRESELKRVAAESGAGRVEILPRDLSELDGLETVVAESERRLGPIDVLVNNAGLEIVRPVTEITIEEAECLFRLNLHAPLRLTRAALPGMLARKSGTIVDVCSVAAYSHPPFQAYYSASKAALSAASVSLRTELRGTGVNVVTVYPGPITTAMGARALAGYEGNPSKGLPWGSAEGLATLVLRAVRRRRANVVYPRFYRLPQWFPRVASLAVDLGPRVRPAVRPPEPGQAAPAATPGAGKK